MKRKLDLMTEIGHGAIHPKSDNTSDSDEQQLSYNKAPWIHPIVELNNLQQHGSIVDDQEECCQKWEETFVEVLSVP